MSYARDALESPEETPRRIEIINTNLIKAQAILAELRATLNHDVGGEHSANLDRLYEYYLRRLLQANLKKQAAPVVEVERLVRQLRDGWAEMLRTHDANNAQNARGVA